MHAVGDILQAGLNMAALLPRGGAALPLSTLILLPALGALGLGLLRNLAPKGVRGLTLAVTLAVFFASLALPLHFDGHSAQMQFVEDHAWVPSLHIHFSLGLDGISLWLVVLTTFIVPAAVLGSWNLIQERVKEFHLALLVMEAAMIGVFCATDLMLFYTFFEITLIPMMLIVGIWGGRERVRATMKFVLYTLFGSLLMLVGIIFLYVRTDTFNIAELTRLVALNHGPHGADLFTPKEYTFLFMAFALAFAIKVPIVPLHTWLPWAYVEAPTPGSVILSAVLFNMGLYGFMRVAIPFFPTVAQVFSPVFVFCGVAGVIYGSLMAMAQEDIKKLIAYSLVAHLGICILGLFAFNRLGWSGALFLMLAHGVSSGAMFILVGMLYERTSTRELAAYGGLARVMPGFATIFMIVLLSLIGLPLTNGFVAEITVFLGVFGGVGRVVALLGMTGAILGAAYMLTMYLRVFYGRVTQPQNNRLTDLSLRETAVLVPFVALIFLMGLAPTLFFAPMEASIDRSLTDYQYGLRHEAPLTEGVAPTVPERPAAASTAGRPSRATPSRAPLALIPPIPPIQPIQPIQPAQPIPSTLSALSGSVK